MQNSSIRLLWVQRNAAFVTAVGLGMFSASGQAVAQLDTAKLDRAVWKMKWADGTPVAAIKVERATALHGSYWSDTATTSSDGTVQFQSSGPKRPYQPVETVVLIAVTNARVSYGVVPKGQVGGDVKLQPTGALKFRLVDEEGLPAAGVKVFPRSLSVVGQATSCFLFPYREQFNAVSDSKGICAFPEMPIGNSLSLEHADPRYASFGLNIAALVGKDDQEFKMLQGATIGGRVVDALGKPVADANVRANTLNGSSRGSVRSGPDGSYLITGLTAGNYTIDANPAWDSKSGLVGRSKDGVLVKKGEHLTAVDLALVRGGTLVGAVVYANTHRAAAGVQVGASSKTSSDYISGITDKNGTYQMLAPPGTYNISVVAPGSHVAKLDYRTDYKVVAGSKTVSSAVLPVEPLAEPLHGRVVDATGAPVPGATVVTGSESTLITAVTGFDGRFAMSEKSSTPARVRAYRGTDCTRQVLLVTNDKDLTLKLAPNTISTIAGRVTDVEGRPLPSARVLIFEKNTRESAMLDFMTDLEGRYSLARARPNTTYVVFANYDGYEEQSFQSVNVESGEVKVLGDLKLPKLDSVVSGRVIDDNGDPVAGAEVSLQVKDYGAISDRDGAFRIEGVARRPYYLLAKKGNRQTVKDVVGGKSDLLVVLKAPPRIITVPPVQIDNVGSMVGKKAPMLRVGVWANTPPLDIAHTKAKAVVLNFWGGTCSACVVEMPEVQEFADQIAEQGVLLVGISDSISTTPQVKRFLFDHKVRFPVAIDTKDPARGFGKTFQAFEVGASPAFIVIQHGTVVCATHSLEEMMAFVNKL